MERVSDNPAFGISLLLLLLFLLRLRAGVGFVRERLRSEIRRHSPRVQVSIDTQAGVRGPAVAVSENNFSDL